MVICSGLPDLSVKFLLCDKYKQSNSIHPQVSIDEESHPPSKSPSYNAFHSSIQSVYKAQDCQHHGLSGKLHDQSLVITDLDRCVIYKYYAFILRMVFHELYCPKTNRKTLRYVVGKGLKPSVSTLCSSWMNWLVLFAKKIYFSCTF